MIFSPSRHLMNDTRKFLTVENPPVENIYQSIGRCTDVNLYRNCRTTLRVYKKLTSIRKNLNFLHVEQPLRTTFKS